jgi:hypothetical protein
MTYSFDTDLFSDMHKDAYGFRPRNHRFYDPSTSDDEKQRIWDATYEEVVREINRAKAEQAEAAKSFETRVDQLIKVGAGDRETALRWLFEAQDEFDRMYGAERMEWEFGLEYGYLANDSAFKRVLKADKAAPSPIA